MQRERVDGGRGGFGDGVINGSFYYGCLTVVHNQDVFVIDIS